MTLTLTHDQAEALRRLLEVPRNRRDARITVGVGSYHGEAPEWAADDRALRDVLDQLRKPRSAA